MQGTGKEPPWLLVGIVTLKHKRRTYKQHWKYTQTSSTNLYQSASCSPWGQYGGIIPSVSRSTGSTPWRWVCAIVTMCVCKWIGFCIIFSYSVCACNIYYKHREYWLTCAPSYTCACPLECFHSLKNLCIDISFWNSFFQVFNEHELFITMPSATWGDGVCTSWQIMSA